MMEQDIEIQTTFNDDDNLNEVVLEEGGDTDVQDTNNVTE